MRHIHLDRVDSTNSYLRRALLREPDLEEYTVITATNQTAGRGQVGHTWDATAGKNLTMTLLLRPEELLSSGGTLYDLNILASLAVRRALLRELPLDREVTVKWPNDILVDGRKICGILIENSFLGSRLAYSIIGIGVNVLQELFGEGYPTQPTSIALEQQRLGDTPISGFSWHDRLMGEILEAVEQLRRSGVAAMRREYQACLFRHGEVSPFVLPNGRTLYGRLERVEPDGRLVVRDLLTGRSASYAFREISMVLTDSASIPLCNTRSRQL